MDEASFTIDRVSKGARMNAPDEFGPPPRQDDDVSRLRVPPHSLEAEQSVLGGMMIDAAAAAQMRDTLVDSDFFRHEHRTIFLAICDALDVGSDQLDVVTVFERLQVMGKHQDVGGLQYLNALAQSVPSASNIKRYAAIVRERATLRKVIAAADEIATQAFNPQGMPIDKLLEGVQARVEHLFSEQQHKVRSRKLPLVPLSELLVRSSERPYLIKGLIPQSSMGVMFGGSGSFKSFISLDASLHVAHGLPWTGRRTKQGAVVYLAAEGADEIGERAIGWHRARRLRGEAPFFLIPMAMDLRVDAWRVVDRLQSAGVTPALIVIDTLSQTFGGEENSASEVSGYFRELASRFRDLWQCAVQVIHHSGHSATERPRGSTAIQANTDYLWGVFREDKEMMATLCCVHRKGGKPFDDTTFQLSRWVLGTDSEGDEVDTLVARHLSSSEEVEQAMEAEKKAGRVTKLQLLLSLLQDGMRERELRKVFCEECGVDGADNAARVYRRTKHTAMSKGFFEVAEGIVITLKASK